MVLAAGASRRFGGNKLHASLWGRPLLAHALEAVTVARRRKRLGGVVLVLAGDDDASAAVAGPFGALLVRCPGDGPGVSASLRLGLSRLEDESLDPPAGAALIVLADQPLLDPDVVQALVDAWARGARIVRPNYRDDAGTPGHPVLLDRSLWHLAARATGDRGLGPLLADQKDRVTLVEAPGANPGVDTPDDLRRIEDGT